MKVGPGSRLVVLITIAAMPGLVGAHGIGEPELEATKTYGVCCDDTDCRHHAMVDKGNFDGKRKVWIQGLGDVLGR